MLTRNIIARALTQNTIFNVSLQNKPLKIAFQGNTKLATQTLKSLAQRFQTKYQTVRTNFHIHPKSFDINSQQHQTLLNRFEFVKNLSQQSGLRGAVGKAMKKSFLQSKRLGFTLKDNEIQEFIKTVQNNFSSQQQVIKIITQCPNLINAKFNIIIQQKLSIIIDYLAISKQQAMKIFQATPFLLPSSPKKFRQSILTLKDVYKFNKQQIIFLMKNMGEIFILGKQTLADIHHLPISWGLTLQQTKKLFLEHPVLFFNYPYNMALFKRRILKFLSFTVPMGRKILLQYPGILVWSVRSLQQKALFVVNRLQMKFNQQNLACLAFNYNKTLRPRGQMLIRSKYVFNDKNIVQLMKLSDEQFCQKTGVALQRLQKQKQKFQISEQLDFRKGRLLDNIKFNQKFKELSKKYEF